MTERHLPVSPVALPDMLGPLVDEWFSEHQANYPEWCAENLGLPAMDGIPEDHRLQTVPQKQQARIAQDGAWYVRYALFVLTRDRVMTIAESYPKQPPLASMTDIELRDCLERGQWVSDRPALFPDDRWNRLDTWRIDLSVEIDDRSSGAVTHAATRGRVAGNQP